MKKADKLISSSRYEGFSIVLLEGIVLKKRVIASNCKSGPKEILADGRGKLFEVGNAFELSENILKNFDLNFEDNFLEKFKKKRIFEKFLRILEGTNAG